MIVVGLVGAVIYVMLKKITWKITCEAVLLYCAETDSGLPDAATIEKYREKIIKNKFGLKES